MTKDSAFMKLMLAAMNDAANEGQLTQLQAEFQPDGKETMEQVRIIIVPEKMRWKFSHPGLV